MSPCRDCGDTAGKSARPAATASGDHRHDEQLPSDAFLALRVAYGMLLGEDDFRVLMGNPRGKQMMHSSWLHGPGVVWGMAVATDDAGRLTVGPGLAVDGRGRELRLDTTLCLDVAEWAKDWATKHPPAGGRGTVTASVVAEFESCADRAVPALADPCDVTRRHDSYSRVVESMRIDVTAARPPATAPYHRLRVLLGAEPGDPKQDAEVFEARKLVRKAPPHERAQTLLEQFRRLAARDVQQWRPRGWANGEGPPQLPTTDDAAGVVLGKLSFDVRDDDGCKRVGTVVVTPEERTALLPTTTVQDLLCGLAPGVIGADTELDAGGPRLDVGSVRWTDGDARVSFKLDRPVLAGSWEDAIEISSLSATGRGWRREHIDRMVLHDDGYRVVVHLDGPPVYETARLVVRGTGATVLFGADPAVPFAGVVGGPPGSIHQGHDAAVNTVLRRA